MPEENEYAELLKVLDHYYRDLVEGLAAEITEKAEDFASPFIGNAESLLEKYALPLHHLSTIYPALQRVGAELAEEKSVRLQNDEYLCFQCRSIFRKEDLVCPECGWTWEGAQGVRSFPAEHRFTERARSVLNRAREYARAFGPGTVEPEHLLLALVEEKQGTAAQLLLDNGITAPALESDVKSLFAKSDISPKQMRLGRVAEQVLMDAWDECRQLEHGLVGTGHLLLGLTRIVGEPADRIAQMLKADFRILRNQVLSQLAIDGSQ
jgi:hypothetical protein